MSRNRWKKVAKKLQTMDRRELAVRTRQELLKRCDYALSQFGFDFAGREPRFPDAPSGSFFFDSSQISDLLRLIRERLPEEAEKIVARAKRICAHRFDLLGYEDLDYGPSINWHLDLVHGKTAPLKPFYRIKFLDFDEVGDSKVIWELNRHQHFVMLAKAYRLTGDERYAAEIFAQWRSWHAANPYPMGINWASSLEVAFRSLSWIWTYRLLDGTAALPPEFRHEWLRAQSINARHMERHLSTYFSPNTHLLGEAVALYFLGTLCSQLSSAKRWKALGWQIVTEEAKRQVNPDGLHFEQSTYYHVYALDFLLHSLQLAQFHDQSSHQEHAQTVERMMEALFRLSVAAPPPKLGDDDGGRLFDPSRNRSENLLDPLASGAVLFKRGDFKQLAGSLREETIWLSGTKGVEAWDQLAAQPITTKSVAFDAAGVYCLAAGKSQLLVTGAPSVAQSYGHSHADALSVCLQSSDRNLLIDSGTAEYVGGSNLRNLYRGTAMHNTLRVDGRDQAEPAGPFSWTSPVRAKAEQWIVGKSFSVFVGSHNGYGRLSQPVRHRRWVVALRPEIFLVRDIVEGEGEHRVDIAWHPAPQLLSRRQHVFHLQGCEQGLAILPVENHSWEEEVRDSSCSPVYGRQQKTTMLNFGTTASLPTEFVTLLIPFQKEETFAGRFTKVDTSEATPSVRAFRYQSETLRYQFFFASAGQHWECGAVSSDADFLSIARDSNETNSDLILCNGSYAETDEGCRLSMRRPVCWCEVVQDAGMQVFSSDLAAVIQTQTPGTI